MSQPLRLIVLGATPRAFVVYLCAAFFFLVGCEQRGDTPPSIQYRDTPPSNLKPIFRLAIHPLYNPRKLAISYQPLIDYLTLQVPEVQFELESSRDYASYEAKIRSRVPELLLPNPLQTLDAIKGGYRVIAMAGKAEDFKGIFIVRKDSNIKRPVDLKGKRVSYPAATALAACIMPQYFLQQHGVNVQRDIENHYVGSQESSILSAYLGESAIAATWPVPWRQFQLDYPKESEQMKVIWETTPLINNSIMVRKDIATHLQDKIRNALLRLESEPSGLRILTAMQTNGIYAAIDKDYLAIRDYLTRFEREVRSLEQAL